MLELLCYIKTKLIQILLQPALQGPSEHPLLQTSTQAAKQLELHGNPP